MPSAKVPEPPCLVLSLTAFLKHPFMVSNICGLEVQCMTTRSGAILPCVPIHSTSTSPSNTSIDRRKNSASSTNPFSLQNAARRR